MFYAVFVSTLGLLPDGVTSLPQALIPGDPATASADQAVVRLEPERSTCTDEVLPYTQLRSLPQPRRSLHLKGANGGQLYYFGVSHTNDPQHPQFEALIEQFHRLQPTLVFYEGPRRSWPHAEGEPLLTHDPEQIILQSGESGFIQHLAQQHNIPIAPLEPSRQQEINAMLEQFSPEQVKLFYVLRQIAELRDRWKYSSETELQRSVVAILDKFSTYDGLSSVITTVDALEGAYGQYWQSPAHWWQAPTNWFNPTLTVSETGGEFTNDLHRRASTFRNQHMVEVLTTAVNQGHRVMAVVGHSHIPLQSPALHCAI